MQRIAIESLSEAFEVVKEFGLSDCNDDDFDWRRYGREALKGILEDRMSNYIDRHLSELACGDELPDRRNGHYRRNLLTELGSIELCVPRTRLYNPVKVVRAYARRSASVDRMILSCFLLGLSTRKVSEALLPVLGESVSASTVSRVAKILDDSVLSFHKRKLKDCYTALVLDGVALSRKTGAGAVRKPVLVALGILPSGKKEIIDYHVAGSESEAEWERFLTNLYKRGVTGDNLKIIAVDGGKGALAALNTVYNGIPVQRCWAHKTRNITDKVKKTDREAVKKGLHKIYNATNKIDARKAAGKWLEKWGVKYPQALKCLQNDLDNLLEFFMFKDKKWRKATRTTNAIERQFREVRRRTRPMGVFFDKTSIERILYAIFARENKNQGTSTPFLLTQNT